MSARELFLKDVPLMPESIFPRYLAIWHDQKALEDAEDEASFWQAIHDVENRENLTSFDSFEDAVRDAMED
jgi:hypothetical protein